MATYYTQAQLALLNQTTKAKTGQDYVQLTGVGKGTLYRGNLDGTLQWITDNFDVNAQNAVISIMSPSDTTNPDTVPSEEGAPGSIAIDVDEFPLSKVDDTNVTLTLGGSPLTALLKAVSLTLGWTGVLSYLRGGTGLSALGTAFQQLRVNATETALEYFTPSSGSGTVTNVDTGTGLTGGPITTTGTISLDSKLSPMDSLTGNSLKFLRVNAGETAVEYATASAGTVTSVATTGLISGGPITTSGTITTSMNTNKLVGRSTAGAGIMEEITVGSGLTLSAGTLTNTATPSPVGYYGAFQDLTNQYAAVINTGYPMLLGVTDLTNGVTVVSGSRVTIANTGIYNIQWSGQFTNPTAAEHDVTVWLRKNGVDVPGSSGIVLVPPKHGSNDGHILPSWNFLLDVVAGDYYEFTWSTVSTSVYLSFTPAGSPPPSTASVVLTVTQQSGIMAGTGMTALNGLTGAVQTFVNDTNVTVVSSGTTHTLTWAGTLADARIASAATWNAKQNAITGAATTITTLDLTALRVLVSDASGKVAANSVTTTTLGYLDATSSIQTQLNSLGATVFFAHAATNPADLTNYFIGGLIAVIPTALSQSRFRIESPITGTFDRLRVVQNLTAGTTESAVIKLNNKTAATSVTLSSAYKYDNTVKLYTSIGLAVTQGDELEIQINTPTWVTNPTSAQQYFYGYIKKS